MDSHMMDRLREEIELCFMCAKMDMKDGTYLMADGSKLKLIDDLNYKAAVILIAAYNQMVKIYYKKEFIKENLYKV